MAYTLKMRLWRGDKSGGELQDFDVEVESGEVVLFWDLPAVQARRLVRALREDLGRLDADAFLDAWREAQG